MIDFINENDIPAYLADIFQYAEKEIIIVSPFIKLNKKLTDLLNTKKSNHKLKLSILFGKNEDNLKKSFGNEEFSFFKEFPNIEIRYKERLHAKYYANEELAIITSMNLYDYSIESNIEIGVIVDKKNIIKENITKESVYNDARDYLTKVIENSETLFQRIPTYENKTLAIKKKYTGSETSIDLLSPIFGNENNIQETSIKGYCIRTREEIPFNPQKPLSDSAFKSWNRYRDKNYREKYCHFSGEESYGETCFAKPILKKNWDKAKKLI